MTNWPGSAAASREEAPVPMRRLPGFLLAALLLFPAAAPAASPRCAIPGSFMISGEMARLNAALATGGPVTIVAFGSSSTEGVGATTRENAYPAQLEALLRQRLPRVPLRVLNRGIGGDTVRQMMARLEKDVIAEDPDLVIWQTGTNDALRRIDLDQFEALTEQGVARIRASGADVMFVEPQYLPQDKPGSFYARYIEEVRAIGRDNKVPVLLRHDAMAHWSKSGAITGSALLSADGLHMTDASYRCLAELAADAIQPAVARPLLPAPDAPTIAQPAPAGPVVAPAAPVKAGAVPAQR